MESESSKSDNYKGEKERGKSVSPLVYRAKMLQDYRADAAERASEATPYRPLSLRLCNILHDSRGECSRVFQMPNCANLKSASTCVGKRKNRAVAHVIESQNGLLFDIWFETELFVDQNWHNDIWLKVQRGENRDPTRAL